MRRTALFLVLLLAAVSAFGHAGEVHNYMGTITALNEDGSFMLKKTDGETIQVAVSKETAFEFADGSAATAADLAAGKRAVVTISKDGKTASTVKVAR